MLPNEPFEDRANDVAELDGSWEEEAEGSTRDGLGEFAAWVSEWRVTSDDAHLADGASDGAANEAGCGGDGELHLDGRRESVKVKKKEKKKGGRDGV